jgi:hypothetical protein
MEAIQWEKYTMTAYKVNSFDVCVSGMERLRNQDEFMANALIGPETDAGGIFEQLLDDVAACEHFADFDYKAARAGISEWFHAEFKPIFDRKPVNPFDLEQVVDDPDLEDYCRVFIYIQRPAID